MLKIKILLLSMVISLTIQAGVGDLLQNIPANIQRHPYWSAMAVVGIPATCFLWNLSDWYANKMFKLLNMKNNMSNRDNFIFELQNKMRALQESQEQSDKDKLSNVKSLETKSTITLLGSITTALFALYGLAKVTGIKK